MRGRKLLIGGGVLILAVVGGVVYYLGPGAPDAGALRSAVFRTRAERRAYDGAPPVIPHPPLGGPCTNCHSTVARELPGVGVAPPNPHLRTLGMSETSRCQQCHVFRNSNDVFVKSNFEPLRQEPRRGERLYAAAPPVLPHGHFMREDCNACHSGLAARPEIRCSHPERTHCLQCHARNPGR